jgi:hypothetical protein
MLGRIAVLGVIGAVIAAMPARADVMNFSCDDGGMLLTIDTDHHTITDKNPFQQSKVVAPLTITNDIFAWQEGSGKSAADYRLDRATHLVSGRADGAAIALSNPQCGRSAILPPKF